ncbi:MAG TPA: M28 family peptidase [Anaerolineales bacterium]|nr:M28 family peptidase [Anaerolineales bacterium]
MDLGKWVELADKHLTYLCQTIDSRRVGSSGNQQATTYAANVLSAAGFQVGTPEFACIDWITDGAKLSINGFDFPVQSCPYSLGCRLEARLEVVRNVNQLENADIRDGIVLLIGEIAKEQIMPKNFEFYNPDEHQLIIKLLESKKPAAIISATSMNPEAAGALYPYPLIEDGDFDIPSVFTTVEEGEKIAQYVGQKVNLESLCQRIPSHGSNVMGRKGGEAGKRIVLTAHIDAKTGTPGALDNATGVVTLLLLSEMLKYYTGKHEIEILLFNGEDYFNSAGEMLYLRQNKENFQNILLNINLDLVGYIHGETAYSLYELPENLSQLIQKTFATHPHLVPGEPWYQGDHMVFILNQVPALAFTAEKMSELLKTIVHTDLDTLDQVDSEKIVALAISLQALVGIIQD